MSSPWLGRLELITKISPNEFEARVFICAWMSMQEQMLVGVNALVGHLIPSRPNYRVYTEELTPADFSVKIVNYAIQMYDAVEAGPASEAYKQPQPGHLVLGLLYRVSQPSLS